MVHMTDNLLLSTLENIGHFIICLFILSFPSHWLFYIIMSYNYFTILKYNLRNKYKKHIKEIKHNTCVKIVLFHFVYFEEFNINMFKVL